MLYIVIPIFLLCALIQSTDTDTDTETEEETPCEINGFDFDN